MQKWECEIQSRFLIEMTKQEIEKKFNFLFFVYKPYIFYFYSGGKATFSFLKTNVINTFEIISSISS
jgi:hypothetical protein